MKILLVYQRFYPHMGGAQNYLNYLAKTFIKASHEVFLVCCDEGDNLSEEEIFKGFKIYRYPMPVLNEDERKYWPLMHQKIFYKFLKDKKISADLVLCRSTLYIETLFKIFDKKKIIYIAPGFLNEFKKFATLELPRQKIAFNILSKMELSSIKYLDKIITLSNMVKKDILKRFNKRNVKVIPPGVDKNRFNCTIKNRKNAIYVGRLTKEKNVESAISTFKYVKHGKLIIIGSGFEEQNLKSFSRKIRVAKKIKFLGWKENPEEYLSKASVFILPSKYESFGHVLLEAMASGLPCIAFKPDGKKIITASDEIIKDGETGFLVKDEKEMAEKIDLLLSDDKLREKMGKQARKEAEKYSWEKCAEEILKFAKE